MSMSCVNLRIRSKKYKKYCYCKKLKSNVDFEFCKNCNCKEYKKINLVSRNKHTRTKATSIDKNVKITVWNRDMHKCIFCNKVVSVEYSCCHFIPRSAGGLGIEENIFTACKHCHTEQDNGLNTKEYDSIAENYLRSKYPNWNKNNLIYKKN